MPRRSSSATKTTVTGADASTGASLKLVKTKPAQLSLFQTFLSNDPNVDEYSNTIELYDAIPKYYSSTKRMAALRKDGIHLPTLVQEFEHKHQAYTLEIVPARLRDKHGHEKEYYPTQREELVEEALKKLACDEFRGVYLDNEAGVQFTLYELREELRRQHHTMNYPDLMESLYIASGVRLKVSDKKEGWKVVLNSAIFPNFIHAQRNAWEEDPKNTRCYVQFNPLVTRSIDRITYRQFHYLGFMQLKNQLARYLFKRLSHNYVQASWNNPYTITLSTILRDSALVNTTRTRDQVRYVNAALDELAGRGAPETKDDFPPILMDYEKQIITGSRNRIEDVTYTLQPSHHFTSQVKKANARRQEGQSLAIQQHLMTENEKGQRFQKD